MGILYYITAGNMYFTEGNTYITEGEGRVRCVLSRFEHHSTSSSNGCPSLPGDHSIGKIPLNRKGIVLLYYMTACNNSCQHVSTEDTVHLNINYKVTMPCLSLFQSLNFLAKICL